MPALALDVVGNFLIEPIQIGVMIGFLGLHKAAINGLVFRHEIVVSNETLPSRSKREHLTRFVLKGAGTSVLGQSLPDEIADVALHPVTITGISKLREIVCVHHAKFASFGECMNLGVA